MIKRWISNSRLVWQFTLVSWLVIAVTGLVAAWGVGEAIRNMAINEAMEEANETLTQRVMRHLTPQDLTKPMAGERYAKFNMWVEDSIVSERTARIKIWNRHGMLIYSNEPSQVGQFFPIEGDLAKALQGKIAGDTELESLEDTAEREFGQLFEVYVPIIFPASTEVSGAFEIYQDFEPTAQFITMTQTYIYAGLIGALALIYPALFVIVRKASHTIQSQQSELRLRSQQLAVAWQDTLEALSSSLDLRDHDTEGHALRVSHLAVELAKAMGASEKDLKTIEYGGLLHDVGKIGVPDEVLLKPGPLNFEEWMVIKKHPSLGHQILSKIQFLNGASEIVRAHHERYDGRGYPLGLKEEQIPFGARIFSVVDTYDAMTSNRPYRQALSHEEAIAEIKRNAGTQFDPRVVETFLGLVNGDSLSKVEEIKLEMRTAVPVNP